MAGFILLNVVTGSVSSIIFNSAYYIVYYTSKGVYYGVSYVLTKSPENIQDNDSDTFVMVYQQEK